MADCPDYSLRLCVWIGLGAELKLKSHSGGKRQLENAIDAPQKKHQKKYQLSWESMSHNGLNWTTDVSEDLPKHSVYDLNLEVLFHVSHRVFDQKSARRQIQAQCVNTPAPPHPQLNQTH